MGEQLAAQLRISGRGQQTARAALLRRNGLGEQSAQLPQFTNNYEFEAMDLDGDAVLDVVTINDGKGEQRFAELALLLFEQAVLAEGGRLDDPAAFVRRVNQLLIDAAA